MGLIIGFFFGSFRRAAITVVVLALLAGFASFRIMEARLRASEAALATTRQMLATAKTQLELERAAQSEADHSLRVDTRSREAVTVAQQEVANAIDAHSFYVSWTTGVSSLRDDGTDSA